MIRYQMDPETTIEQKERDNGYHEYIISKSYQSSSRKQYLSSIKYLHWWYNYLKKNVFLKTSVKNTCGV